MFLDDMLVSKAISVLFVNWTKVIFQVILLFCTRPKAGDQICVTTIYHEN